METLQRSAASWATRSRRAGMRGWRALGRSMRKLTDNSCVFGATCPTVLLQTSRAGWECRWWGMLSCAQQTAVASCSAMFGAASPNHSVTMRRSRAICSSLRMLAGPAEPNRPPKGFQRGFVSTAAKYEKRGGGKKIVDLGCGTWDLACWKFQS